MANLFETAPEKGKAKKANNDVVVKLPALEDDLTRIAEIDAAIDELTLERNGLDANVRDTAKTSMLDLYNKKGTFPGTLKIESDTMAFQFITSDRYEKIDEDRFNELAKMFGTNAVEKTEVFLFNNELLPKYMQVISDMISKSKGIEDSDKGSLINKTVSYTVKKGLVKDLMPLVKKSKKTLAVVVDEIRPVFSIKGIQEKA